jgi:hypothetical protein
MGPLGSERLVRGLRFVAFGAWPISKDSCKQWRVRRYEISSPEKRQSPFLYGKIAIPAINCLRLDTRFNVIIKVK